ncbi:MAG: galactosyltransferase-related protein, partial [Nitrospirota bacterium]
NNDKLFNKGKLLNIGAMEARAESEYLCLHDVDFLPIEADYRCCTSPVRLPGVIEADFHYGAVMDDRGTVYPHFFSGAVVIDRDEFKKVNGFSNDYWHWGMEDRDFFMRLLFGGLVPLYSPDGRFEALHHEKSVFVSESGKYETAAAERERLDGSYRRNVRLFKLYKRRIIDNQSGLSSIEYKVTGRETCDGFTMITVSL